MDTETSINGKAEPIYTEPGVHSTTDAAAKMAHDLIDRVARVARESEEHLRDTATSAESSLQHTLSTARSKTTQAGDSIGEFVRQHPVAALSIAFGSGVLLSYLTRSRVHYDAAE
jgi:ElaB/YqjD/DUF883 family membrane-anchored ribosome-binding protein